MLCRHRVCAARVRPRLGVLRDCCKLHAALTVRARGRWFTKLGHKGAEPRCFRFVLKIHFRTICDSFMIRPIRIRG